MVCRVRCCGGLQLLLASLRYSDAVAFDPSGFCAAFRDFDGQCLAPLEQRDADEFLHELLQRIEDALGTKHPLLDSIFGGALAQLVEWTDSAGTPQRSERAEAFRVLQLEIRGIPTTDTTSPRLPLLTTSCSHPWSPISGRHAHHRGRPRGLRRRRAHRRVYSPLTSSALLSPPPSLLFSPLLSSPSPPADTRRPTAPRSTRPSASASTLPSCPIRSSYR
jgi:hypothetical protein